MLCFDQAKEALHELMEGDRYQISPRPWHPWACMPPRVVVHIDLGQDDCQEVARKLDLWERIETRRSRALLAGTTAVLADALVTSLDSPSQDSAT